MWKKDLLIIISMWGGLLFPRMVLLSDVYQLWVPDVGEHSLDPNMEEMKLPRANRTIIADSILADLDKAVMYLNTQNNSATMRIHKDVARALKSEVALFEGTWEKYHKAKNDKFFDSTVTDEKIRDYFNQAVAAAKEVMDRGVWAIYNTGNKLDDIVRCSRLQIIG